MVKHCAYLYQFWMRRMLLKGRLGTCSFESRLGTSSIQSRLCTCMLHNSISCCCSLAFCGRPIFPPDRRKPLYETWPLCLVFSCPDMSMYSKVWCTVYRGQCTLFSKQNIVYSVQWAWRSSELCIEYSQ